MFIVIYCFCFSCNYKSSQYKCPKCSIDYCSLNCFKDPKHTKCTEKFYEEQIRETLKSEKVSELSDEREKMIKILEKLNNLDFEEEADEIDDTDEFDVDLDDLDNLKVEELEELLGESHLAKVKELIEIGVTSDWLKSAGLSSDNIAPWFMRYLPSSVVLNEDIPDYLPIHVFTIPDIKTLTKKTPSDFLWNNLLEICVIYSFIYFQFTSTELKNHLVIETEVKPIVLELCSSLMQHKSVSKNGNALFTSAVDALEAAKSSIFFNSSEHNISEILDGVINLLKNSEMLIIMLSDMLYWFQLGTKKTDESFFAEKKLIFMTAWINSEVSQSKGSVAQILKTLANIVEQIK